MPSSETIGGSKTNAIPTTFTWWKGNSSGLMHNLVAEVKIN